MSLLTTFKSLPPMVADNHASAFSAAPQPDGGSPVSTVLSCQVNVGTFAQLFLPETETKRVAQATSEARRELRQLKTQATRLSGWPKWVRPDYVRTIQQLGCHEQVREMIEKGFGLVAIANKIHEHEEMTQCAVGTVENYLTHYKATIPKHVIARKQLRIPEAEQSLKQGIDVRQMLEDLYQKMEARIEIGFTREKQMNFLIPGMEKQFIVAAKLLKEIYEFDKEMGFGEYGTAIRNEKPSQPVQAFDLDKVYSRTGLTEMMQDPTKRMRIVSCVERLLDLGKKADEMEDVANNS